MKNTQLNNSGRSTDKIGYYFLIGTKELLVITVRGIIYNVGLLAGPIYEGKLAQCLADIFTGSKVFKDMVALVLRYIGVIAFVQGARCIKRLYVRKFANKVNLSMRKNVYSNIVTKSKRDYENESAGSVMTKAVGDVDACSEGIRKFTTEIFDTGVAIAGYVALLLRYDVKLALLCLIFPPISYIIAERMKGVVQKTNAESKESAGKLNRRTLERVTNAISYRILGIEKNQNKNYEDYLTDYEKKAVKANIWVSAMPPLYKIISTLGVVFIMYFGAQNVSNNFWNIATFTAFLACYLKLAEKSSKAAKLFNAVHKAQVSWVRIKPYLNKKNYDVQDNIPTAKDIEVVNLGFVGDDGTEIFKNISFNAHPGQIIGVTGPVAAGKSLLGKAFLQENRYLGSIKFGGEELSRMSPNNVNEITSYLGHNPELLSDSVKNNVLMGDDKDINRYLKCCEIYDEVMSMPEGVDTHIGSGGVMLSGGQQQRIALARTLAHKKAVMVLDDPFSALDKTTEQQVFRNIKEIQGDSIIFLISHRLYLFPELDSVIWLDNKTGYQSTHEKLMEESPRYRRLFLTETKGGNENE